MRCRFVLNFHQRELFFSLKQHLRTSWWFLWTSGRGLARCSVDPNTITNIYSHTKSIPNKCRSILLWRDRQRNSSQTRWQGGSVAAEPVDDDEQWKVSSTNQSQGQTLVYSSFVWVLLWSCQSHLFLLFFLSSSGHLVFSIFFLLSVCEFICQCYRGFKILS